MASFFILLSLILTLSTTSAIKPTIATHSHHHLPPQQHQLNSIIDAIIGAGDFNNWADLLGKADPSIVPITVTFFIPDDDAFPPANDGSSSTASLADPRLFTYHIIPRRFSFSDLRQFPIGARLPTLLLNNTLLITNNSATNFTINGAVITHPDLFHNAVVSVHGIGSVLNYTLFGKDNNSTNNSNISASSPETESFSSFSSSPMAVNEAWKSKGNRNARSHLNFILVLSLVMFALYVLQCVGFDIVIQNKGIKDKSDCKRAAAASRTFLRFSSCNHYTMAAVECGLGFYLIMVLICSTYAYIRGFHG